MTPGASQAKNASAFRLDALTIENGTIVYRDTASGTIERIRNLTADISAGSFTGPFAFKGGLTVRDTPLTVKADVRRFVEKGALPFHVTLGAPGSTAEINLSGTVTDVETKPSVSAKLDGKGDNLAGLLASLTRSAPLAQLGQSFAVSATMAGSEKAVAVNDLVLQLGKSTATGNIRVALENGIRADVAVRMASLDADAFLAVSETSRSQPASPGSVAPSSESSEAGADNRVVPATPAPAFELPKDIEANIDLTIDEVVAMQDRIRSFRSWYDPEPTSLEVLKQVTEAFPEEGTVTTKIVEIRNQSNVNVTGIATDNSALLETLNALRDASSVGGLKVDQIRGRSPLQFTFNFEWKGDQ